jgi:hypothetical protein
MLMIMGLECKNGDVWGDWQEGERRGDWEMKRIKVCYIYLSVCLSVYLSISTYLSYIYTYSIMKPTKHCLKKWEG